MADDAGILITGGTIVELDPPRVETGDVLVRGAKIEAVGDVSARDVTRIDARGCLVMPAFVVGHTHLYSALACGMPPPNVAPSTFVEILERVWWRLDRALDDDLVQLSAMVGAAEAARRGAACVIDHHASPNAIDGSLDRIANALDAVGVRGVLCYETTDRNGPAGRDAGLRENERFAREKTAHGAMIGAHAPFTLDDVTLDALRDLTTRTQAPLHVHVAEDTTDITDAVKRGTTIDARLERLGLFSAGSIVAHAVHLPAATRERLDAAGAYIVTNARSNMNNAVGLAPARGEHVALGTDGIGADMIGEAQTHFFRHAEANDGLAGDAIARLVASQDLAACVLGESRGVIAKDARADLCILSYDPATPLDAANIGSHVLFGLTSASVRDTIAGGRVALRDRKLTNIDEHELAARARIGAKRLWQRMESI